VANSEGLRHLLLGWRSNVLLPGLYLSKRGCWCGYTLFLTRDYLPTYTLRTGGPDVYYTRGQMMRFTFTNKNIAHSTAGQWARTCSCRVTDTVGARRWRNRAATRPYYRLALPTSRMLPLPAWCPTTCQPCLRMQHTVVCYSATYRVYVTTCTYAWPRCCPTLPCLYITFLTFIPFPFTYAHTAAGSWRDIIPPCAALPCTFCCNTGCAR